ncbi:MAG: hypothetical protein IAE67_08190 [Candidatus Competibacteraceae bacterium]|nr:hypothetical protein [Candidatus Competibacteraceae bacterium]
MSKLSKTWLTDPHIDAEYKSYILLAYLQRTSRLFEQKNLYPALSDLIEHYSTLYHLRHSSEWMKDLFPKQITGINMQTAEILYNKLVDDNALLEEIWKTIEFSIPVIEEKIQMGREIYDEVEQQIRVSSVGIIPLKFHEGYMLINRKSETFVFKYEQTLFTVSSVSMRSIRTEYISTYPQSLQNTYSHIKYDLVKNNPDLPNPAVFSFDSAIELPFRACYFPIAKRMLMQYLQLRTKNQGTDEASC